jgi:hypothetical protein
MLSWLSLLANIMSMIALQPAPPPTMATFSGLTCVVTVFFLADYPFFPLCRA